MTHRYTIIEASCTYLILKQFMHFILSLSCPILLLLITESEAAKLPFLKDFSQFFFLFLVSFFL